jgi:hypothetical protein
MYVVHIIVLPEEQQNLHGAAAAATDDDDDNNNSVRWFQSHLLFLILFRRHLDVKDTS